MPDPHLGCLKVTVTVCCGMICMLKGQTNAPAGFFPSLLLHEVMGSFLRQCQVGWSVLFTDQRLHIANESPNHFLEGNFTLQCYKQLDGERTLLLLPLYSFRSW